MSLFHSAEEEMRPWECRLSSRYLSRGLLYALVDLPRLRWEPKRSHKQAVNIQGVPVEWQQSKLSASWGRGKSGVGTYPKAMPAGGVLGSCL